MSFDCCTLRRSSSKGVGVFGVTIVWRRFIRRVLAVAAFAVTVGEAAVIATGVASGGGVEQCRGGGGGGGVGGCGGEWVRLCNPRSPGQGSRRSMTYE